MIKVYFGPKKHCPADELPRDERFLWLSEFDLLKGMDQDFWTNNPLMLDFFDKDQIMLWSAGGWQPMSLIVREFLPGFVENGALAKMSPALLAVVAEQVWEAQRREAQALRDQKAQP